MPRANLFLLFSGKERTKNYGCALRSHIRSTKQNKITPKKNFFCINVNRTTKMRHADRNICTFASFADHLRFCFHTRLIALNEQIVPHRQMGLDSADLAKSIFCLFVCFVVFYVQCVNYNLLAVTFFFSFSVALSVRLSSIKSQRLCPSSGQQATSFMQMTSNMTSYKINIVQRSLSLSLSLARSLARLLARSKSA